MALKMSRELEADGVQVSSPAVAGSGVDLYDDLEDPFFPVKSDGVPDQVLPLSK